MRPKTALLTALLTGTALAGLPATAHAATVDPAALSYATVQVSGGPWAAEGTTRTWRSDVASLTVQAPEAGEYVDVMAGSANDGSAVHLQLNGPGLLAPGTYTTDAGSTIYVNDQASGQVCYGDGRFEVTSVAGDFSSFHVTYEVSCDGRQVFSGEVRHHVPATDSPAAVLSERIAFPEREVSFTAGRAAVTILNTGAESITVTSAAISAGTYDFWVAANPCGVLTPGASCAVTVTHRPNQPGPRTGTLTIGTSVGDRTVALTGHGIGGFTSWSTWTEPDANTAGSVRNYGPANARITVTGSQARVTMRRAVDSGGPAEISVRSCVDDLAAPGACTVVEPAHGSCYAGEAQQYEATVHEIALDDAGRPVRLSLTYKHRCNSSEGFERGSVAWRATQPARSVPGVDGVAPDPVRNVQTAATYDEVTLTWARPTAPDWSQVVVRGAKGTTAPSSATAGFAVYTGRGTAAKATGLAPGSSYAFALFARDSEGLWSARRTVVVRGAGLTLSASRKVVDYGSAVTFRGRLTTPGHTNSSYPVRVLARHPVTHEFYEVDSTYTAGSDGTWSVRFAPARAFDYYAVFNGAVSPGVLGTYAGPVRVQVARHVDVAADRKRGPRGTTFRIGAAANPAVAGYKARLQERVGGVWRTVRTGELYRRKATYFSIRPARGKHVYRVVVPKVAPLLAGTSRLVVITVT